MNIQADIEWIKSELDNVRDPNLIDLFKRLLSSKNNALQGEMDRMILEAEADISKGDVVSHEELGKRMAEWRK